MRTGSTPAKRQLKENEGELKVSEVKTATASTCPDNVSPKPESIDMMETTLRVRDDGYGVEERRRYARIRIPAVQYSRRCWPMKMQQHGYSREEILTYRHFALEDFWAGFEAALNEHRSDCIWSFAVQELERTIIKLTAVADAAREWMRVSKDWKGNYQAVKENYRMVKEALAALDEEKRGSKT